MCCVYILQGGCCVYILQGVCCFTAYRVCVVFTAYRVCVVFTAYIGCFEDAGDRLLPTPKIRSGSERSHVTPDTCSQACSAAGFSYAGIEVRPPPSLLFSLAVCLHPLISPFLFLSLAVLCLHPLISLSLFFSLYLLSFSLLFFPPLTPHYISAIRGSIQASV